VNRRPAVRLSSVRKGKRADTYEDITQAEDILPEEVPVLFKHSNEFLWDRMKGSQEIDLREIAWNAVRRYGFDPHFPDSVIREVEAINPALRSTGNGNVRDLRELLWSSIDNADSLDLDQLEICEMLPDGMIRVRVAIADVDVFVPRGSFTDRHAARNGTSVYTGIVKFPMLPDRLSHGITSLLPEEQRYAMVIEFFVLQDGSVQAGEIYRALVTNKAQLVYERVAGWQQGMEEVPPAVKSVPGLEGQVTLQDEAARRLKKARAEQGALTLDTIEARPVVEEGKVQDLVVQRRNRARCIIEEFMVAANGTLVGFLGEAGVPMIQRVVRIPRNWDGIVRIAATLGETLPVRPDARALARFLTKRKAADPERFPDLSLAVIKLLGPGEYAALAPGQPSTGHFSLAVSDYTHATAPNRRYVDLVNQRLLKAVLTGGHVPYTIEELEDLAAWLTDRDKAATKVERFMRKAAAGVLLRERIGQTFDAFVTGVTAHGTFARIIVPPAEGKVIRGERGLSVGDRVRVRLLHTDPYNGHIDLERA
jgi:exoribonuclease-2